MKSVEELNGAVRLHRTNNDLTRTELAVLEVLAQYSCVDPGVSYLRKSKIAELVGKSRRTVIRICNRLESLGIIRQYKRMRQSGDRRQTSNSIVIQPAEVNDVTPECHSKETPSKNLNNTISNSNGALKRAVYSPIYNALSPYFNDEEIYRAIGLLYRAKAKVDRSLTVEDYAEEFIDGFKAVVYSYKRGKVRSIFGCLYAAWHQVALEIKRKQVRNSGVFYDWIKA